MYRTECPPPSACLVQVYRICESCVKDTALDPEEAQICQRLADCMADMSPDAVACRLKLCLVAAGTPMGDALPFR